MFAKNFKKIMKEKGFTAKSIAEQIGVTRGLVTHWSNGVRHPDDEQIKQIAETLKVHVGELFGEEIAVKTVPLIGVASCGVPNIAYPDAIENIAVPENYARDCAYAVKADGDSMLPKIKHGDIILCDREMEVNNGDIVHYTTIDGESGLKKYQEHKNIVTLYPLNTEGYAPLVIDKNDLRCAKAFMIMSSL